MTALPDSLAKEGLFCCWRYEERNGRRTKVPYQPDTGQGAKSNDPRSFVSYETAMQASGYDGIGIGIFNGICAIDLDGCVTDSGYYHELFDEALTAFNAKQKRKDRCIENYYEKIRDGKQEKPFYEVIFQIGNVEDMSSTGKNGELARTILDKFMRSFQERNPNLHVFSAHLHMDEATPHLHIDFIPFTTGSKRGLSTRVSLKQALADQGIIGEGRSMTERAVWVQKQKEALAEIMLEHGIEWEQKGEHREHLSVLEYKREQRTQELAELEQTIQHVQQQQIDIEAVAQIKAKPLPFSSKVSIAREDYEKLATAAEKYVVQEKQEGKLKKLLKEAKKTIVDLKNTITDLKVQLAAARAELGKYKSVRSDLRTGQLEQENKDLRSKLRRYEEIIDRNSLWAYFSRHRGKTHMRDDAR